MDLSPAAQDTGWEYLQPEGVTMTDYELVYLFVEIVKAHETSFMKYVAVLFSFLLAGYLVADKLESKMVFIIVGLFTLVALQMLSNIFGFGTDVASLGVEIQSRASDGATGLDWHGAAAPWGVITISVARITSIAVVGLSYIGALIFFFHQRHVGRAQ